MCRHLNYKSNEEWFIVNVLVYPLPLLLLMASALVGLLNQ